MTLSDLSEADGNQDDSSNLFRILISSDIHLGYAEKDPERGVDSFNSFDELLGIGEEVVSTYMSCYQATETGDRI